MTSFGGSSTDTGMNNDSMATSSGPVKGFFIIRPVEAKFIADSHLNPDMYPYCKIKLGWHTAKTDISSRKGLNPCWPDVISLDRKHGEKILKVKIKDKNSLSISTVIAEIKVPLDEVIANGAIIQWFNLEKKHKIVGEILLDIAYSQTV